MNPLLPPLLVLAAALAAAETPPQPPATDAAGGEGQRGERWRQRLVADNPELKDADPSTPEGQERIRKAMQAQFAKRRGEMQAASLARIRESLAMPAEDFAAIEPMIQRVQTLRLQRMLDPAFQPPVRPRGGPGGPGGMDLGRMIAGDAPEPAAKEIQDAAKALGALAADRQANDAEVAAALARLRKARTAFQGELGKAQEELRSVLTPRQEAVLVDQGLLE